MANEYRAVNGVLDRRYWGVESADGDTVIPVYRSLTKDDAERIAAAFNALAEIASNDLVCLTGAGAVVAKGMRDTAAAALNAARGAYADG